MKYEKKKGFCLFMYVKVFNVKNKEINKRLILFV